jgi:hypothetical protein
MKKIKQERIEAKCSESGGTKVYMMEKNHCDSQRTNKQKM